LIAYIKTLFKSNNLQNVSVLVLVNYVIIVIGFLTKIVIANTMGKAAFGQIAYATALGTYGMVIARYSQERTLVRDVIQRPHDTLRIIPGSLVLRITILFILMLLYGTWFLLFEHRSGYNMLAITAIVMSNWLLAMDLQGYYDAVNKIKVHALFNLMQKIVNFAAIWIVFIFFKESFNLTIVGFSMLSAALLYIYMQHSWVVKRLKLEWSFSTIVSMPVIILKKNSILFLSTLGGLFIGTFNQITLEFYGGAEELGTYSAAWQFVTIVMTMLLQIARVGNANIAKISIIGTENSVKRNFVFKYSTVMFLLVAPVSILMIFSPNFLINLFYKPEYLTATTCMPVFGVYLILLAFGMIAEQYIISSHKEKIYFVGVGVGTLMSIITCMFLVPVYHSLGAAISLLISHGIVLIICVCYMYIDIFSCKLRNEVTAVS